MRLSVFIHTFKSQSVHGTPVGAIGSAEHIFFDYFPPFSSRLFSDRMKCRVDLSFLSYLSLGV